MVFRNPLQYLLVKRLKISNKAAISLIESGEISVNDKVVFDNFIITESDSIFYKNQCLNQGKKLLYIAFYKPFGIETTLNESIENNLNEILPFEEKLFPAGRLDKSSEGLLLLTNDGRFFHQIINKEFETEKEYIVTVDKKIDDFFAEKMANGIEIMYKKTLPCKVQKIDDFNFNITLIQGLNRQIRRMCYKLDYEVTKLVRIRIGKIRLENLKPFEYRFLEKDEIL